MHKISNIYWERVNLHIVLKNKIDNKKAYLVYEDKKLEVPINDNEIVINVTNRAWASYHLDSEVVAWLKENV